MEGNLGHTVSHLPWTLGENQSKPWAKKEGVPSLHYLKHLQIMFYKIMIKTYNLLPHMKFLEISINKVPGALYFCCIISITYTYILY